MDTLCVLVAFFTLITITNCETSTTSAGLFEVPVANSQVTAIRLVSGTLKEGRLEILYNGSWGTVCDDAFGDDDATVFCRMLGYVIGHSLQNAYGSGSGSIWLDNMACFGTESRVDDCGHDGWGSHNCAHYEDVSIACSENGDYSTVIPTLSLNLFVSALTSIRLSGGNSKSEGRLELQFEGRWGTVCDDLFSDTEATVFCRMLGYPEGDFLHNKYGPGTGDILLDDVDCTGTERVVDECNHNGWGEKDCSHSEDVSIRCTGEYIGSSLGFEASSVWMHAVDTRLVGTPAVLYQGIYGYICDDGSFSEAESDVICRELGFDYGEKYDYGSSVDGFVWLQQVQCSGGEEMLRTCGFSSLGANISYANIHLYPECSTVVSLECKNNKNAWKYPVIGVGAALGAIIVILVMCLTYKTASTVSRTSPSSTTAPTRGTPATKPQSANKPAKGSISAQACGGTPTPAPSSGCAINQFILQPPTHALDGHLPPLCLHEQILPTLHLHPGNTRLDMPPNCHLSQPYNPGSGLGQPQVPSLHREAPHGSDTGQPEAPSLPYPPESGLGQPQTPSLQPESQHTSGLGQSQAPPFDPISYIDLNNLPPPPAYHDLYGDKPPTPIE